MSYQLLRISIIFISFFSIITVNGQRFGAGVQGGISSTKISGDMDPRGGRLRLGAYGSVFTNYPVNEFADLQLELMYIQKGSRAFVPVSDDDPEGRDYKLDLHYVEIPVVYKLDLSRFSDLEYISDIIVEAGISASTVIGHYEENDGIDITGDVVSKQPFNSLELNLVGGLYFPVGENFKFHFRASQGVTPVRPHGTEKTSAGTLWQRINQHGQYNTVFSFGLSYNIFLWRRNSSNRQ